MTSPTDTFRRCYLGALLSLAASDGEVSEVERSKLAWIADRLGWDDSLEDVRPWTLSAVARTLDHEDLRNQFLIDAVDVASCDSVIHEQELECIRYITDAWALSPPAMPGVNWGEVTPRDPFQGVQDEARDLDDYVAAARRSEEMRTLAPPESGVEVAARPGSSRPVVREASKDAVAESGAAAAVGSGSRTDMALTAIFVVAVVAAVVVSQLQNMAVPSLAWLALGLGLGVFGRGAACGR